MTVRFVVDAQLPPALVRTGPQIVWVRIGNTTTPQLISRVRGRLPELLKLLEHGEHLIELA